uniref:Uncharacterized protein n=1 Tax=Setaria italica TaxID=4555 RepID=K3ZYJ4_SETIT
MNLLDDFAEIEKMEMASDDLKGNVPRAYLKKADMAPVTPEKSGNDPADSVNCAKEATWLLATADTLFLVLHLSFDLCRNCYRNHGL